MPKGDAWSGGESDTGRFPDWGGGPTIVHGRVRRGRGEIDRVQGVSGMSSSPGTPGKKVLFVCSSGGHLSQLLQLRPWWISHERRWVTFDLADARSKLTGEELVAAHYPTTRNAMNLVRNFRLAWTELAHSRPDVIISNGAAVALPFFVIGKVKGIPTVYLEVYDRIDSRTLTGRLVRPFTTRFCVQWPEQQRLNPGSVLVGPLY